VGWEKVDLELRSCGILPSDFSVNPKHYFMTLLSSLGLGDDYAIHPS
jgi:hypothetical protein